MLKFLSDIVFMDIAVFLFAVFISSYSQVLLKKEALCSHKSYVQEYLNYRVAVAYIILAISIFLAIYTYRNIPLSLGPVLESTGYIYVTIFGVVIFKERINIKKIIALCMIIVGIIVYGVFGG